MKTNTKKNDKILLSTIIISIFLLLTSSNFVKAQETKEEKYDKLADSLETFQRVCFYSEFVDSFSPQLIESFTTDKVNHEDEMARLDSYLAQLNLNPSSTGYIVVYGGRTNKYGEYDIRVGRIKDYIAFRSFDDSRIKYVNGGFREKFEFELWLSPRVKNAFPPISPTIAPEKVKFKGKMKPFGI